MSDEPKPEHEHPVTRMLRVFIGTIGGIIAIAILVMVLQGREAGQLITALTGIGAIGALVSTNIRSK